MIRRTFDWEDVARQTDKYKYAMPCFWPPDWVASENNYALIDEHDNIGLLDYQRPGVYEPHLYFESRGREAIDVARDMIDWTFDNTPARRLEGQTPILCKGAWYVVRKIGFKRTGIVFTEWGPMHGSVMTKELWNELRKKNEESPNTTD